MAELGLETRVRCAWSAKPQRAAISSIESVRGASRLGEDLAAERIINLCP